jgi:hypothetical protein
VPIVPIEWDMKILSVLFATILFVASCSDPSEAIINVTSTTGGHKDSSDILGIINGDAPTYTPVVSEATSVKVSELQWKKSGGVWAGRKGKGKWWRPADADAVKAIEAYMEDR